MSRPIASTIRFAESDDDLRRCFPVMLQLRTHLADAEKFIRQVRRQSAEGYRLVFLEDEEEVRGVSGFRIFTSLADGRVMHVDDLVTDAMQRSRGYGDRLFDWLVAHARAVECDRVRLDSGVQRFAAHRFYLRKRMSIVAHHFVLELRQAEQRP
jgi:GNAT superfamily N-acetyltransferase